MSEIQDTRTEIRRALRSVSLLLCEAENSHPSCGPLIYTNLVDACEELLRAARVKARHFSNEGQ